MALAFIVRFRDCERASIAFDMRTVSTNHVVQQYVRYIGDIQRYMRSILYCFYFFYFSEWNQRPFLLNTQLVILCVYGFAKSNKIQWSWDRNGFYDTFFYDRWRSYHCFTLYHYPIEITISVCTMEH